MNEAQAAVERQKVITKIAEGIFDAHEDILYAAIKRRRTITDLDKINHFQVGQLVQFNSQARPKYLKGVVATITDVKPRSVTLKLPENIDGDTGGRFRDRFNPSQGAEVSCPVGIIDPAYGDDQ